MKRFIFIIALFPIVLASNGFKYYCEETCESTFIITQSFSDSTWKNYIHYNYSILPAELTYECLGSGQEGTIYPTSNGYLHIPCCDDSLLINSLVDGSGYCYYMTYVPPCEGDPVVCELGQDTDLDGICDPDDCDPLDPIINYYPGYPCDDGNPLTIKDIIDTLCNCIGILPSSCNGESMVDYDKDGICDDLDCDDLDSLKTNIIGSVCDDLNIETKNDSIGIDCICVGEPDPCYNKDMDGDGICDWLDQCPALHDTLIGATCDDGNPLTINDFYDSSCKCIGTPTTPCTFKGGDSDGDGICDYYDCEINNPNNNSYKGKICDDGDPNTMNDIIDENCLCSGKILVSCPETESDIDGDGICDDLDCDANDPLNNRYVGAYCNDGNPNTLNDRINANCNCSGTLVQPEDKIVELAVSYDDWFVGFSHIHSDPVAAISNYIEYANDFFYTKYNIFLHVISFEDFEDIIEDSDTLSEEDDGIFMRKLSIQWAQKCYKRDLIHHFTSGKPGSDPGGDKLCSSNYYSFGEQYADVSFSSPKGNGIRTTHEIGHGLGLSHEPFTFNCTTVPPNCIMCEPAGGDPLDGSNNNISSCNEQTMLDYVNNKGCVYDFDYDEDDNECEYFNVYYSSEDLHIGTGRPYVNLACDDFCADIKFTIEGDGMTRQFENFELYYIANTPNQNYINLESSQFSDCTSDGSIPNQFTYSCLHDPEGFTMQPGETKEFEFTLCIDKDMPRYQTQDHGDVFMWLNIRAMVDKQFTMISPTGLPSPQDNFSFSMTLLKKSIHLSGSNITVQDIVQALGLSNVEQLSSLKREVDIVIDGTLELDGDIEFNETIDFSMEPDSKISILENSSVKFNRNNIRTCGNEMWQGIQVLENSFAIFEQVFIENAEVAISVKDGSELICNYSSFVDNNISIELLEDGNGQTLNSHTLVGNTFEGSGSMLPNPNLVLGDRPMYGIIVENYHFVDLVQDNDFVNLVTGIYSYGGYVKANDCYFTDCLKGVSFEYHYPSSSVTNSNFENCNTGIYALYNGGTFEYNTITNSVTGIQAMFNTEYEQYINYNEIDADDGIKSFYNTTEINYMSENIVNFSNIGLELVFAENTISGNNELTGNNSGIGVDVLLSNTNYFFNNDVINSDKGARISGSMGTLMYRTDLESESGTIGFEVLDSPGTQLECGVVVGYEEAGMMFLGNCQDSDVTTNDINDSDVGLQLGIVGDPNSPSIIGLQEYKGNIWLGSNYLNGAYNSSDLQSVLDQSVFVIKSEPLFIPPNPYPSSGWIIPTTSGENNTCPKSLSLLTNNTSQGVFDYLIQKYSMHQVESLIVDLDTISNASQKFNMEMYDQLFSKLFLSKYLPKSQQLRIDSLYFNNNEEGYVEILKELNRFSSQANEYSINYLPFENQLLRKYEIRTIMEFIDTSSTNMIGLGDVESDLNLLDGNYKSINLTQPMISLYSLFLETKNIDVLVNNQILLKDIISNCIKEGSYPVFLASAMVKLIDSSQGVYNFDNCNATAPRLPMDISHIGHDFILHPNPTNSSIQIESNYNLDQKLNVELYNINGGCLFIIEDYTIGTSIDISSFQPGTYLVKIVEEDGNIESRRIIKH